MNLLALGRNNLFRVADLVCLLFCLLTSLVWPVRAAPAAPNLPQSAGDPHIIVYLSNSTYAHFRAVGGDYETLIQPWRKYFAARPSLPVQFTRDLKSLEGRTRATLVLPSAASLTQEERTKIMAFFNRGGAIFATWATGTWSGVGQWAGWDFLKGIGGTPVGDYNRKEKLFMIIRGETPISFNIPAGERISLAPSAEGFVLYRPDNSSAARLVDWERLAEPDIKDRNGIAQFREVSRTQGRTVLFGFSENAWPDGGKDIYPLIDDGLSWLSRTPEIVVSAWPQSYAAAHVLEMDTEEGFPAAENLSRMAISKNIPVSFFVLSSVASQYPELLRKLNQTHEIALHGDIHDGFAGQSAQAQFKRLRTAQTDVEKVLGPDPARVGFRPPREEFDQVTEAVLIDTGISYAVINAGLKSGRLPFVVHGTGANSTRNLIALPRTQRDDLNLLISTRDPLALEKALTEDLTSIADHGGLAVLSIHSQNFGPGDPLAKALPPYLDNLNTMRGTIWVTDTGTVARWWRDRSRVRLESTLKSGTLNVRLDIGNGNAIEGISAIVMSPERGVAPKIAGLRAGAPRPTIDTIDPLRYRLRFPALNPGHYDYQLTF